MYVKKFLMSVGTFSTVALPVASVVSCGEEETKDTSGSDQSSGTEQITTAEVDDSVVKLSIDLTEINTPEELINKILEASNMQYSENFLEILAVDDPESPTKLTEESRQAFIDYYANIKPIEVNITNSPNSGVTAILDLTNEITTIIDQLENKKWNDNYIDDILGLIMGGSSKAESNNITAYIGFLSPTLGMGMINMRIISDLAWEAYNSFLEKIHDFIWTIATSKDFESWNVDKEYKLTGETLFSKEEEESIFLDDGSCIEETVKSGDLFDDPTWVSDIGTSNSPSKPEESSNLEAAFAIEMLNLFYPTI